MLARVANPPNPFSATHVDWLGEPPPQPVEVYFDHTREILSVNDSPDIPFRYSVNPYRGCFHGCAYCYARPTHEYLSFGAGTDFDRKLVVKPEAPALLKAAFERRSWQGELVVFSGNTDCYQPLEASYGLTRACLEVCLTYRNPVGVITKAALIERDTALLAALAREARATVTLSIPFWDASQARAIEPAVPPPARRMQAVRRLAEAGVPVGVNVAPIIPGLNDSQLVEVLERAREAGAVYAGMTLLRLPGPVAQVFEERLRGALPERAERVMNRVRETRGGNLYQSEFGKRMRGEGEYAGVIETLFRQTVRRLGFTVRSEPAPEPGTTFRRPPPETGQLSLL